MPTPRIWLPALRHMERELRREERIEEGHIQRVPSLADLALSATDRTIATKVARAVAVVIASHAVPGHDDLLARTSEWVMKACDAPERLDNATGLKVKMPLPIGGLLEFDMETMLSDDLVHDAESPPVLGNDLNLHGEPGNDPQVELVEEEAPADNPPDESGDAEDAEAIPAGTVSVSAALGWPVVTEWPAHGMATRRADQESPRYELAAWLHDTPQARGRVPGPTLGARDRRSHLPPATGIVIWGSAKGVALGTRTRILGADILLSCARRAAFEKVYDGTAESAGRAMRAARGLEIVVFLDPDIHGGAWIDVDPLTQAPAATLLIDMPVAADGVPGFRLLQS